MKVYPASAIRNVAVVGHNGVGKTTLVSALLHDAGATPQFGRIEDGNAPTDFDPEEIERKISIRLAVASLEWKKKKINLIDSPGLRHLRLRDALRPAGGRRRAPRRQRGRRRRGPDREGLEGRRGPRPAPPLRRQPHGPRARRRRPRRWTLQKTFGRACVPVEAPIGQEKGFRGVVDLVAVQGSLTDDAGKTADGAVPEEFAGGRGAAARARRDGRRERRQAHGAFFEQGNLTKSS